MADSADDDVPVKPVPPVCTTASLEVPTAALEVPVVTGPDGTGRRGSSPSPSRLSAEITLRMQSQMGRLSMHLEAESFLPDESEEYTLDEINAQVQDMHEQHRVFLAEHTQLMRVSPRALLAHEYFTGNAHTQACRAYSSFLRAAARRSGSLRRRQETMEQLTAPAHDDSQPARLPNINLPTFKGDYAEWPTFSELFTNVVTNNTKLSDVARLHYLRGCLEGQPAQLISSLHLTGASFAPSWDMLTAKYENRRLHIQSHLDALFSVAPLTSKSAAGLNTLISRVSESNAALGSLGVENLGECILVHHTSRHLDRSTQEAWETSLGASQDYPSFAQLEEFLMSRARALERVESACAANAGGASKGATRKTSAQHGARSGSAHQASVASEAASAPPTTGTGAKTGPFPCDLCQGSHFLVTCEKFRALGVRQRRQIAMDKRLCFNCLRRHSARACRSTHTCKECASRHHSMLHDESSAAAALAALGRTTHRVRPLLTPQPALRPLTEGPVQSSAPQYSSVRILVDPGSELTFATERLIDQLSALRHRSSIPITGIGGTRTTQTRGIAQLILRSTHTSRSVTVQAHILRTVTTTLPSFETPAHCWPHLDKLTLADPDFLIPRPIDVIIGADFYGQIIRPNIAKGSPQMPIAQLSIFGWLVLGPVHISQPAARSARTATVQHETALLQELLTRFWVQEELPSDTAQLLTPEEEECEAHFRSTHSRDDTGRYVVRIPLALPASQLGDSYATAHRCLTQMLRRHSRDHTFRDLYRKFMAEYEELGHMSKAAQARPSDHEDGGVFNGSSATTSGRSINDLMHTGAKLQLNIPDVLIRIRLHRHIFATDITKMFRQINVHPDDWDLQRILWIDDQLNTVPYQLTTVTYGTRAAPFLSVRTLLQLAEDEGHRFPLAVPPLRLGRYVDDIFGGADTPGQLIEVAQQLKHLYDAGGFPLAKWHSTCHELLVAVSSASTSESRVSLDDCATKILGIFWVPDKDRFVFSSRLSAHSGALTKRHILSEVAQIFDPLGFISPVTVRAKMLLQELWLHKLGWDDALPSQISTRWLALREDLISLARLSLPRWLNTQSDLSVVLHGFSDASQLAMSAVVYIVVSSPSTGAQASLVCSKTKVAPLKRLTIPRLELTAALLLTKLVKYVHATLDMDVKATHLWTDSHVTLMWIRSHPSRWRDYVRNRVTQIQDLAPEAQWRHVPGKVNPADCASRGVTTAQLKDHSLWWTGPPWITQSELSWPAQPPESADLSAHDIRPGISLTVATPLVDYHWDLIHKVSSFYKLVRLTAICFRVARKLRGKLDSPVVVVPSDDMLRARQFWVKATQATYFSSELAALTSGSALPRAHPLTRLTAFVDGHGILRVGGRLHQSALTQEGKHPAILPRHVRLSLMIIDDAHQRTLHGGTQLTLARVRQSFWILGGRAPVKSHILRCVVCARQRGIRAHQLMGQLPLFRVTPSRPFFHTGVDYAGPLTLKAWRGRGSKTIKGWICVFVCFATSAVHLEAVSDYSADGFIAAYRRFTARRGIAHTLYSDCGTNFVGADAELRRMFNRSSAEHHRIAAVLSHDNSQWSFNPPASPHMGGKWEAVVKSAKFHLRRTVAETLLTFEELATLLSQIEAVLNSRPLEPLTDDPQDVSALTPGHFLTGSALTTLPEPSLLDLSASRLSRWQLIQQRVQGFWAQWSAHYLQRQQSISKWHHATNIIKVGSLVLLTDERFPPCKWPLARVVELHPSKDGLARVATIRTATTTLTRPLVKLAPLPTPQPDHQGITHQQPLLMAGGNVGESSPSSRS